MGKGGEPGESEKSVTEAQVRPQLMKTFESG